MMNKYRVTIILKSPVCIAKKRNVGNVIETLDYIPGSTIRGALADLFLKKFGGYVNETKTWANKKNEEIFNALFISARSRFGNCYIRGTRLIPLTASSCKYSPGFNNGHVGDVEHGVFDQLQKISIYELNAKRNDLLDICQFGECKAPLDRFSGFYLNKRSGDFKKIEVSKRLMILLIKF